MTTAKKTHMGVGLEATERATTPRTHTRVRLVYHGDGLTLEGHPVFLSVHRRPNPQGDGGEEVELRVYDFSEYGLFAAQGKAGRLARWTLRMADRVGEAIAFGTGGLQLRDAVLIGDYANEDHIRCLLMERGLSPHTNVVHIYRNQG